MCMTTRFSPRTMLPLAPSWMRTLTMSIGWMMVVAPMPLKPPMQNGRTARQTALTCVWGRGGGESEPAWWVGGDE